jgi:polyisoprenoid-binding protein YceI
MKKLVSAILIFGAAILPAAAQQYSVSNQNSEVEVQGTSTIHDWEMIAKEMSGKATITMDESKPNVSTLNFIVPVKNLKSGKSSMDKNAWEALEVDDHPTSQYQLKEVKSVTGSGNTFQLSTVGSLNIAGSTKTVSIPVKAVVSGSKITFSGKTTFKMSSYGIEPPTALMGTITTGDEITVEFKVNYQTTL